ncbi:proteasome endopeptidase complex [Sarracenia purpurea var. burkii]
MKTLILLKQVNMIGVHFEDNRVATGFGNHLARPILRDEWHENSSFEDGVKLLEKCMRVLLYRDRSAVNKFQEHPFNGKCENPEQKVQRGIITVTEKRSGYDPKHNGMLEDFVLLWYFQKWDLGENPKQAFGEAGSLSVDSKEIATASRRASSSRRRWFSPELQAISEEKKETISMLPELVFQSLFADGGVTGAAMESQTESFTRGGKITDDDVGQFDGSNEALMIVEGKARQKPRKPEKLSGVKLCFRTVRKLGVIGAVTDLEEAQSKRRLEKLQVQGSISAAIQVVDLGGVAGNLGFPYFSVKPQERISEAQI